jgi:hypothetical protein
LFTHDVKSWGSLRSDACVRFASGQGFDYEHEHEHRCAEHEQEV